MPTLYRLQYLFVSLIITLESAKTAIKLGTARNSVTPSDRLIILLKFIAEPAIMQRQYII